MKLCLVVFIAPQEQENEDLGDCGNVFPMHWTVMMFDPYRRSNIRHIDFLLMLSARQTDDLQLELNVCYKLPLFCLKLSFQLIFPPLICQILYQ